MQEVQVTIPKKLAVNSFPNLSGLVATSQESPNPGPRSLYKYLDSRVANENYEHTQNTKKDTKFLTSLELPLSTLEALSNKILHNRELILNHQSP